MAVDLKKAALGIGEDAIVRVVKEIVRPVAEQMIKDSENKFDDMALPFLDQLEGAVLKLVDQVDGEEG